MPTRPSPREVGHEQRSQQRHVRARQFVAEGPRGRHPPHRPAEREEAREHHAQDRQTRRPPYPRASRAGSSRRWPRPEVELVVVHDSRSESRGTPRRTTGGRGRRARPCGSRRHGPGRRRPRTSPAGSAERAARSGPRTRPAQAAATSAERHEPAQDPTPAHVPHGEQQERGEGQQPAARLREREHHEHQTHEQDEPPARPHGPARLHQGPQHEQGGRRLVGAADGVARLGHPPDDPGPRDAEERAPRRSSPARRRRPPRTRLRSVASIRRSSRSHQSASGKTSAPCTAREEREPGGEGRARTRGG